MSYQTKAYLQTRYETGDIPTQQDYYDVFDSFARERRRVTLTVDTPNDLVAVISYQGDTAPTLIKVADGQFRIDVAAGVFINGFHVKGNNNNTVGSAIEVIIRDAGGASILCNVQVFAQSDGQIFDSLGSVVYNQTEPLGGDVSLTFPNVGQMGAAGFVIVANCSI